MLLYQIDCLTFMINNFTVGMLRYIENIDLSLKELITEKSYLGCGEEYICLNTPRSEERNV